MTDTANLIKQIRNKSEHINGLARDFQAPAYDRAGLISDGQEIQTTADDIIKLTTELEKSLLSSAISEQGGLF
jgi:hypothetical protein